MTDSSRRFDCLSVPFIFWQRGHKCVFLFPCASYGRMLMSSPLEHGGVDRPGTCYMLLRNSVSFTSAEIGVSWERRRNSPLAGRALNLSSCWIEVCCYFRGSGSAETFKALGLNIPSTSGCSQHSCDMNVLFCLNTSCDGVLGIARGHLFRVELQKSFPTKQSSLPCSCDALVRSLPCSADGVPAIRPWSRRLLLGTRRREHTHTRSLPVLSLPSQSEFMVQPSYLTSALQFSRNP